MDEIQLRFRDKYVQDLKEKNYMGDFDSFTAKFESVLSLVQEKSKASQEAKKSQMRTFDQVRKIYLERSRVYYSMVVHNRCSILKNLTNKKIGPSLLFAFFKMELFTLSANKTSPNMK